MKEKIRLLKDYYHLGNKPILVKSLIYDLFVSMFGIGSGIFISIIRRFLFKFFLKVGNTILIGTKFKIINPFFLRCGNNLWITDDVTFAMGGKLEIGDNSVLC